MRYCLSVCLTVCLSVRLWYCIESLGSIFLAFYRATLCVSAVFAVAGVCLSICLSVTLVHYIQTVEDIVKLLCRPGI